MTSKRAQASTNNATSNFGIIIIIITAGLARGIKQILT